MKISLSHTHTHAQTHTHARTRACTHTCTHNHTTDELLARHKKAYTKYCDADENLKI